MTGHTQRAQKSKGWIEKCSHTREHIIISHAGYEPKCKCVCVCVHMFLYTYYIYDVDPYFYFAHNTISISPFVYSKRCVCAHTELLLKTINDGPLGRRQVSVVLEAVMQKPLPPPRAVLKKKVSVVLVSIWLFKNENYIGHQGQSG